MKLLNKHSKKALFVLGISAFLTGCQEMNSRVDEQLDKINRQAEELDSAVDRGLDKVEHLDSTITSKTKRIKDLDSIVRKTTTRIDSLVNDTKEELNRQVN